MLLLQAKIVGSVIFFDKCHLTVLYKWQQGMFSYFDISFSASFRSDAFDHSGDDNMTSDLDEEKEVIQLYDLWPT